MNENVYEYAARIIDNNHHEGKMIQEMANELLKLEQDYYDKVDELEETKKELEETKQELDEYLWHYQRI